MLPSLSWLSQCLNSILITAPSSLWSTSRECSTLLKSFLVQDLSTCHCGRLECSFRGQWVANNPYWSLCKCYLRSCSFCWAKPFLWACTPQRTEVSINGLFLMPHLEPGIHCGGTPYFFIIFKCKKSNCYTAVSQGECLAHIRTVLSMASYFFLPHKAPVSFHQTAPHLTTPMGDPFLEKKLVHSSFKGK